jgi:hypothetical protein
VKHPFTVETEEHHRLGLCYNYNKFVRSQKIVCPLLFRLELGDTDDLDDQEETNPVDTEPQNPAAHDDRCLY